MYNDTNEKAFKSGYEIYKQGRKEQRNIDIRISVKTFRELNIKEEDIKKLLMRNFEISAEEIEDFFQHN